MRRCLVIVRSGEGAAYPEIILSSTVNYVNESTLSMQVGSTDSETKRVAYAPPPGWYVRGHQVRCAKKTDGDGRPDVATADFFFSSDAVSVLLGNGDGSFQGPPAFDIGSGAQAVAAADLNRDGIPDVVAANYFSASVSVLLGNGDGTFRPQQQFAVGDGPIDVA